LGVLGLNLSKIDHKVLDFVCLKGAQIPEAEIAKQLRLKPSTVNYSLKKMARERTILSYRYRINYARLGLSTIAWVLLKVNISKVNSFQLLDDLLKFPQVHVASFITGDFDLAIKVIERDVLSVDSFVRAISEKFSELITASKVLVVTRNYKAHNIVPEKSECLDSFDETDFQILNSRACFPGKDLGQIASELGIHRNTVGKRWKELWDENVVLKKTPVINPMYYKDLNISLKALVFINAAPESSEEIAQNLVKMDEVHELNRMLGEFNLMALIRSADIPNFLEFLMWILFRACGPGSVKKSVSIIVLKSKPHAPDYLPKLLEEKVIKFRKGKLVCLPGKPSKSKNK